MKALLYRYGSVCEPDIIDTLKRLGFNVIEETTEIHNKQLTPKEALENVSKLLQDHIFSFVFTINFFPWLSELCNICRLTYISLIVDSPVLELYSHSIQNPCNRIFLFDSALYNEFYKYNPDNIFYTPLATNMLHNEQLCNNETPEKKRKFSADVSFIGSLYSEKCLYNDVALPDRERGFADGLIESQLKIYGYNFIEDALSDSFVDTFCKNAPNMYSFPEKYFINYKAVVAQQYLSVKVAEQERIRALTMLSENFSVDLYTNSDTSKIPHIHNKGFAQYRTEMPLIFKNSKINLNITAKSIRNGLSLRVFDVLGCGGFLITNYQNDLPELFEPGVDLEVYSSLEELHDKVGYYLTHENERISIAKNGYEKVKKFHSYDTRIQEMLSVAFLNK